MTSLDPDIWGPIVQPPSRDPLPFTPRPRPGGDTFDILGTAHFTRRSVAEAMAAASSGRYDSLALELDRQRFEALGASPVSGEFMAASDAFGNRDGDIWLIDWSLGEIRSRLSRFMSGREAAAWNAVSNRLGRYEANGVWLWEAGRSDEALRYLGVTTDAMARYSPSLHRVLMEERNLVMASRLLDIREANPGARTLVLVGRAHVEGLEELLSDPGRVRAGAKRYGLDVSPAERVRRVKVT